MNSVWNHHYNTERVKKGWREERCDLGRTSTLPGYRDMNYDSA